MTSRMQVTLDPSLRQRVSLKADKMGISIAEYVRRTLEKDVQPTVAQSDVTKLFDLGSSKTPSDIARNKKEMIAESLYKKLQR